MPRAQCPLTLRLDRDTFFAVPRFFPRRTLLLLRRGFRSTDSSRFSISASWNSKRQYPLPSSYGSFEMMRQPYLSLRTRARLTAPLRVKQPYDILDNCPGSPCKRIRVNILDDPIAQSNLFLELFVSAFREVNLHTFHNTQSVFSSTIKEFSYLINIQHDYYLLSSFTVSSTIIHI